MAPDTKHNQQTRERKSSVSPNSLHSEAYHYASFFIHFVIEQRGPCHDESNHKRMKSSWRNFSEQSRLEQGWNGLRILSECMSRLRKKGKP